MSSALVVSMLVATAWVPPVHAGGKRKAKAGTPTLSIGPPGRMNALDRVQLGVFTGARTTRAVLTLTISRSRAWRRDTDTRLDLALPRDARVVGLAATLGTRPRLVGTFAPVSELTSDGTVSGAWPRFVAYAHDGRDTALLTYRYAADRVAHYTARVSPLTQGAPATLEIVIELPATRSLAVASGRPVSDHAVEIDSAPQTVEPLSGNYKAHRLALPAPATASRPPGFDASELVPAPSVDRSTSLLVEGPHGTP